MDCEFISQIRHILKFQDFQDVQLIVLSSLSFEEQKRINDLIITPNKENQNIGKSILVYDINQTLKILDEIELKMKDIQLELNNCIKKTHIFRIEYLEERQNNYHEVLNELSDFISYLLAIALKYDWKLFKDKKWFELMEQYVPTNSLERKLFDKHIQRPKGRPKNQIKSLHYFLNNRKKYFKLIPELHSQYRNSKPSDIHYMVFILYYLNIFSSKVIEDKSSLHRCLVNIFGAKTTGSRQGLDRKLNELIIDENSLKVQKFDFHKQKIKSILDTIS